MKHKTLFLLLLSLLPLVVLTGASLWDFLSVPPRSAPDDQELLQSVAAGRISRQNGIKAAEALQLGLADAQLILPLDPENSDFLNNMAHYGEYRDDLVYIQRWNSVLTGLLTTLQPLRKVTPKALEDAEEMSGENEEKSVAAFESLHKAQGRLNGAFRQFKFALEEFTKAVPETKLAQKAQEFKDSLNEMLDLVMKRVLRAKEMHQLKASFMKAKKLFEEGELLKCNQLCAKILTNELADEDFLLSVQKIHYHARAKRAIEELTEIEKMESRPQRRLERLEELAEKVRDAGKRLDEKTKESLASDFLESLNTLITSSVEEIYTDEIQEGITTLEKNPHQSFSEALHLAGEIAEKVKKMDEQMKKSTGAKRSSEIVLAFRTRLQEFIKSTLNELLPEETETDENIQEAVLTGRKTVTGYFKPVEEDGKKVGYKIYDSYEDFQNPTGSKGVTPLKDFLAEPGPSLETRCVKDYVLVRQELLDDLENRTYWNRFLEKCEEIQKDLDEWQSKTGLKVRFSLKKPISIAKGALKDENWAIMKVIFQ